MKIRPSDPMGHIAFLCVVILLSIDTINPVKIISGVLGIPSYLIAIPCCCVLGYIVTHEINEIIYFSIRIFFSSILSIFFSSIEIVGRENVPKQGPIIFVGNHANQFVDGLLVMTSCSQKVGFLIAEKSYYRPIIGHFARALHCIPVTRPQDSAIDGKGKISLNGTIITGDGTCFTTQIQPGDKIRFGNEADGCKIACINSDTELILSEPPKNTPATENSSYKILKKIDQSTMFQSVYEALARGDCIGIFPEGGSHDRTDLLPLKVGVSIITYGCLEERGVSVPIVPIGLNYYRADRFRGRVVIEFGPPIQLTKELVELYQNDRKTAYNSFLSIIEEGMRGVIVTTPDYDSQKLLHTARRLYQRSGIYTAKEKQDLNRRFAAGFSLLLEKYKGQPPEDIKQIIERLKRYQETLAELGLRDSQVPELKYELLSIIYRFGHVLIVLGLASLPTLFLNLPVGIIARISAAKEQKKALETSVVKIYARDVVLSKKIIVSIAMVPILWVAYAILFRLFTNWNLSTILLIFFSFPFFSYLGVRAVESGMVDLKDLWPAFCRLLPLYRKILDNLPQERAQLQADLRNIIKKYGPSLGKIYFDEDLKSSEINATISGDLSTENPIEPSDELVENLEQQASPRRSYSFKSKDE